MESFAGTLDAFDLLQVDLVPMVLILQWNTDKVQGDRIEIHFKTLITLTIMIINDY